tara:strand:+ start:12479 stop:13021 length:543 start_codon:yes stop_codon:yes gene_type:complete
MPGFAINNTPESQSKDFKAEFRRKHRWRLTNFEDAFVINSREFLYLSKAARPSFKVEPAEVHHDQEVASFAGKQSWDTLNLEFYDAVGGKSLRGSMSSRIYAWVTKCTQIGNATVALPSEYKVEFEVQMTDGQGGVDEIWRVFGAWCQDTNWNELDYGDSNVQLVSVVVKFDRAERISGR